MPVSGDKYSFTQDNVNGSPDKPGVYALYDGNAVIYYGKAEASIRSRLQAHRRGDEGKCTQRATHYKREVCSNPKTREKSLLDAYKTANGKYPRCNERSA
jgi:excinuclease UvrABC nuclease subunit